MRVIAAMVAGMVAGAAIGAIAGLIPISGSRTCPSPRSLAWVEAENAQTFAVFEKDARYAALFADALKIAEATDRIPMHRS